MLLSVLAKVYKEADVEETGVVDAAKVPSLATKILGSNVTEHETQLVVQKTEAKGGSGKWNCKLKAFLSLLTEIAGDYCEGALVVV